MAFISLNSRVVEHRTRLVCLGETPSPRVRCQSAMFTYLLTYVQLQRPAAEGQRTCARPFVRRCHDEVPCRPTVFIVGIAEQ
jgi:hypothetical protein